MHSVVKQQKNSKGDPLGTLKKFRKKSHSAEKKFERGDFLVPTGFAGYFEKNEKGTLCTKFALAPLPDWAP